MRILASLTVVLSFMLIGGCGEVDSVRVSTGSLVGVDIDIEFGPTDNSDSENIRDEEEVKGTVVDIIPSRDNDIEGIDVTITNDDGSSYSATTENNGDFSIEANIKVSSESCFLQIEFTDPEDNDDSLGEECINILPGVKMNLGDITLDNNRIELEDKPSVNFIGEIEEIDCANNLVKVEIGSEVDDVRVQIDNSTDIETDDGNEVDCDDFTTGDELEIDGELRNINSNTVDADSIVIQ